MVENHQQPRFLIMLSLLPLPDSTPSRSARLQQLFRQQRRNICQCCPSPLWMEPTPQVQ